MGDLYKYIQRKGPLTENLSQDFTKQLANGLHYMRTKNLIHRDLKPQNLLLKKNSQSQKIILKIADFGFVREAQRQDMLSTMCGSPLYMVCVVSVVGKRREIERLGESFSLMNTLKLSHPLLVSSSLRHKNRNP